MNDVTSRQDDDKVDLGELALAIWSGRLVITATTIAAVLVAGLYAYSAEPKYMAEAVFELKSASSKPPIPSEAAAFAAMAGVSLEGDQSKGIFDRLVGRDFIQRLSADLSLEADPYFNPPRELVSTFSVASLKLALGLGSDADLSTSAQHNVTRSYLDAVSVSETKNGSIKVGVVHKSAEQAAEIANGIVTRVLDELASEQKQEHSNQLSYLSDQLGYALAQMEAAKKAVADFALANSLASPEAFASRSQAMFELRENLRRTRAMAAAVSDLVDVMARAKIPEAEDYAALRARAPIIDDVEFRRLIGVPEALDAWEWPPRARLQDFASTLRDRTARIERLVAELRDEAERYASSTERLASLEREARVAEATYSVLIEQVKAQALVTGYQGDMARLYQSATPPEHPSTPRMTLILALGAVFGVLAGLGAALIAAMRSGRLYSAALIAEASGAPLTVRAHALGRLAVKAAKRLSEPVEKVSGQGLSDLLVALKAKASKVTLIGATAPQIMSFPAALWIAHRMKGQGYRTAVLVLGEAIPRDIEVVDHGTIPTLAHATLDGVSVLVPSRRSTVYDLLTSDTVHSLLTTENRTYDRVIIAAASDQAVAAARAFGTEKLFTIIVTRQGQTLKSVLDGLRGFATPDAIVSLAK